MRVSSTSEDFSAPSSFLLKIFAGSGNLQSLHFDKAIDDLDLLNILLGILTHLVG